MRDLKDRPEHLVLLLAFVACILGVFELVLEFEEGIFDLYSLSLAYAIRSAAYMGLRRRSLPAEACACWPS